METKLLKIYVSENKVLLGILKSKLEDASIACEIRYDFPPAAGEITPVAAWPELWILNDAQSGDAKEIILQALNNQNNTQSDWQCPKCGEHLEGQFKVCWKCGYGQE